MTNKFVDAFNEMAAEAHQNSAAHGFWDRPRNIGEMFMLMVTELAEGFEATRVGDPPDDKIPEFSGVEAELADVLIRIGDFAAGHKLRVAEAVIAKMRYNKSRPHMHGKLC